MEIQFPYGVDDTLRNHGLKIGTFRMKVLEKIQKLKVETAVAFQIDEIWESFRAFLVLELLSFFLF